MNLTAKQQLSRNPSNAGYSTPLKTYSIPATENQDGTINVPAQPVYGIDPNHEPIDLYMAVRTYAGPSSVANRFAGVGITNPGLATFGAPAGFKLVPLSMIMDIVCTGTVGNRLFSARLLDDTTNIVWIGPTSTATTAGQTCGYDIAFPNGPINTTVRRNIANTGNTNVQVTTTCPITMWQPTWSMTIDDLADVDAADLVTFRFVYQLVPL